MKIGYFNTVFPYRNPLSNQILLEYNGCGGVENVAYNLTVKMGERGHEIHFFSSSINKEESIEKYGNINIYRYRKSIMIGRSPVSFDFLYKPLKLKTDLDIIHTHLGNLPAPLTAYWYAKRNKKPFIITYHGDYVSWFGGPVRRIGVQLHNIYFADKLLSNADVIIALSSYNINDSRVLTKYKDKIKVIPNGVNLEEFNISLTKEECREKLKIPSDSKVILFVGSFTKIKAPDILLRAMKYVVEEIPDAYLIFVGDGALKPQLEAQTKKYGIENNVKFTGFISDMVEKAFYYHSSDIFVLPSFSECFSVVLLEASACGLPLVVSNLESLKAIVKEGYNGSFIKRGDEKDLSRKLIYLLQNDDIRKKFGNNSKELVKKYTWERIAKDTEKIYQELLGK